MDLHQRVMERLMKGFDAPIIQNDLRGRYMEIVVTELLASGWSSVGGAWAGWDVEHSDKTRVEVKQSAARQSWAPPKQGRSSPRFDIRASQGYWDEASDWVETNNRLADIYIFAWHDILDESSDQRDPNQWKFFVVEEKHLPKGQKSIGLGPLTAIAAPVTSKELRTKTENIRKAMSNEELVA